MKTNPDDARENRKTAPGVPSRRLRPEDRLRRKKEFDRVYGRRRTASDGTLLVFGRKNDLDRSRLGLSVSRKVGGAVARNRWKRLIREAFRRNRGRMPRSFDWIVIPRFRGKPDYHRVADSLVRLTARIEKKGRRKSASPHRKPRRKIDDSADRS